MKANASHPACPRLFEVEALRDGRLTGAELTHFQSHARSCHVCAQEMRALAELADALRSPSPEHEADELHVRRERTRLLAAFDAKLVPSPSRSRTGLWLAAVAALALVALVALRLRPSHPVTPVATAPSSVQVQAAASARWSRRAENQSETITLESGTLSISVDHQLPHRRLRVLLPDGEIEDVGTTFAVTAVAGRTTQVTVQDGSVILRLHSAPALTLRAGDAWAPAPVPTTSEAAPSRLPTAPVHDAKPMRAVAPTPSSIDREAHEARVPHQAPSTLDRADPAADFRAATSALTSGDNARAASLFAAFIGQYPRDSRTEDAAYLRVLALQRAGNSAATKRAAEDYLRRYPHGFRRAEVEPLARCADGCVR